MTQFKKMKMRINNPDHSKAVQEWLFEQGYKWHAGGQLVQDTDNKCLYTSTFVDGEITTSRGDSIFDDNPKEEINVQHLDPHLYTAHKSTCVPAKSFMEKPKMKSEFEKLSQQLKHLDKAIDGHENKQNKRKLDRQRIIENLNGMLPEKYKVVDKEDVENKTGCGFNPNEIVVGSVWECINDSGSPCWWTEGKEYMVRYVGKHGEDSVTVIDDEGDENGHDKWDWLSYFKRIS